MIFIEILKQENKQSEDEFRDYVQIRLNEITKNNPNNILNMQWLYDSESYYPLSCIVTFYKENS